MAGNSWIDDGWSHDWLFWFGLAVATVTTALAGVLTDVPVWRLVVGWLGSFAVTVAVFGFARTAWRAYRQG